MNVDEFKEELNKLNVKITKEQEILLEKYYNFLVEYNKHTNLTAITQKEEVYIKHFYDSLTIVKAVNINDQSIIDVGTGAGFPGLVLKIIFPNIKLTLLDSNNKKTTFLQEMVTLLNLHGVKIENARAEEFAKENFDKYDMILQRGVR